MQPCCTAQSDSEEVGITLGTLSEESLNPVAALDQQPDCTRLDQQVKNRILCFLLGVDMSNNILLPVAFPHSWAAVSSDFTIYHRPRPGHLVIPLVFFLTLFEKWA